MALKILMLRSKMDRLNKELESLARKGRRICKPVRRNLNRR